MGTYYVHPRLGNDANNGTSPATPWLTIPGARTLAGSAYLNANYGGAGGIVADNAAKKIQQGSIIRLPCGETYDFGGASPASGYLWLSRSWYADAAYTSTTPAYDQFIFETYFAAGAGPGGVDFGTSATDPFTIDGQYLSVAQTGPALVYCMLDGVTFRSSNANGFVFANSKISHLQCKTKQSPSGRQNQYVKLTNCKGYNNGTSFATDLAGAASGSFHLLDVNHAVVTTCIVDGNNRFANGFLGGENNKTCVDALFSYCTGYNLHGTAPDEDSGMAFKFWNGQVTFDHCEGYSCCKCWDCGHQASTITPDITYILLDCLAHDSSYGTNFNCAATAYAGAVNFYNIRTQIYNNTTMGVNCYSGPYNYFEIGCLFYNNGSVGVGTSTYAQSRATNDNETTDTGTINIYRYNNIYSHGAGNSVFQSRSFKSAIHHTSWYQDWLCYDENYGVLLQAIAWSSQVGPENKAYAFGANGPGHGAGSAWFDEYSNSTTPPASGALGHYHCDEHSKGTGCTDTSLPSFTNTVTHDYTLTAPLRGVNLSTLSWWGGVPATVQGYMLKDRTGAARTTWDIGPFDVGLPLPPVLSAPGTGTDTLDPTSNLTPTFTWAAAAKASCYVLYIYEEPYAGGNLVHTSAHLAASPYTLAGGILTAGTKYRWTMASFTVDDLSDGTTSTPLYFTTPVIAPVLVSPGTGTDTSALTPSKTVSFTWTAAAGAARYGLYLYKAPYAPGDLVLSDETITGVAIVSPPALEAGTKYRWYMASFSAGGLKSVTDSGPLYFKTPADAADVLPPVPLTPATSSSTTMTPTFTWEAATNAVRYGLYIRQDPFGPSDIVWFSESLTGTDYTLAAGILVAGTYYRFSMSSFNAADLRSTDNSDPRYFTPMDTVAPTTGDVPWAQTNYNCAPLQFSQYPHFYP